MSATAFFTQESDGEVSGSDSEPETANPAPESDDSESGSSSGESSDDNEESEFEPQPGRKDEESDTDSEVEQPPPRKKRRTGPVAKASVRRRGTALDTSLFARPGDEIHIGRARDKEGTFVVPSDIGEGENPPRGGNWLKKQSLRYIIAAAKTVLGKKDPKVAIHHANGVYFVVVGGELVITRELVNAAVDKYFQGKDRYARNLAHVCLFPHRVEAPETRDARVERANDPEGIRKVLPTILPGCRIPDAGKYLRWLLTQEGEYPNTDLLTPPVRASVLTILAGVLSQCGEALSARLSEPKHANVCRWLVDGVHVHGEATYAPGSADIVAVCLGIQGETCPHLTSLIALTTGPECNLWDAFASVFFESRDVLDKVIAGHCQ